ncbi:MAG: GNAT family N-acetyltransferase [Flavobacteriaceae bacterium]|nr:GNAT family N-acetyltransferase [Flavobacteriaceae bacterium]|tara:strand:- start:104816 stop:105412 length:597 start_codon:yes stop_codon:yes gene_type:complete
MNSWLQSISLEGRLIRLEFLQPHHLEGLSSAVKDGKLWELYFTSAPHPSETKQYIEKALQEYHDGLSYPFVVVEKATHSIVGTTRYMNIEPANKRLEIGTTWYSKSAQRTGINTECKFLLIQHAFEVLQCNAVEFRTHHENIRSQKAIERLGASLDGILRHHKYDKNGNLRNTYVYSILQSEWSQVKESLISKMNKSY